MADGIAKLLGLKAWTDDEILRDLSRRGAPAVPPAVLTLHGMTVFLVVFFVALVVLGRALLKPAVALEDWLGRFGSGFDGARTFGTFVGFGLLFGSLWLLYRRHGREERLLLTMHDRLSHRGAVPRSLGFLPPVRARQVLYRPWTAMYVLVCAGNSFDQDDDAFIGKLRRRQGPRRVANIIVAAGIAVFGVISIIALSRDRSDLSTAGPSGLLRAATAVLSGTLVALRYVVIMSPMFWAAQRLQRARIGKLILYYAGALAGLGAPPVTPEPAAPAR